MANGKTVHLIQTSEPPCPHSPLEAGGRESATGDLFWSYP